MWPEQGQVELFGDGDFRCPLSNLPAKAVRADGGYRVDGWWDYGSGCDTATHFIGGIAVEGEPGHTRWAAFPRAAYAIVDNWDTLGMRGTGSRRVVVEDLFVPEHHTVAVAQPRAPVRPSSRAAASTRTRSTRGGTIMPLLVSEPAAVAVGDRPGRPRPLRRRAADAPPVRPDHSRAPRADDVPARPRTGDRARRHRRVRTASRWRRRGRRRRTSPSRPGVEVSDEEQRRLLLVCQQIVELCAEAVDVVFRTAGTTATRKGEAVERCFRDVNMIRTHVTMQFDRTFENVGQLRLGLPPAGFF